MYVKQTKENYVLPEAQKAETRMTHSLLSTLSYPGTVNANFGNFDSDGEWGNNVGANFGGFDTEETWGVPDQMGAGFSNFDGEQEWQ